MTTVFYEHEPFSPPVHAPDFLVTETDSGYKLVRGRDKSGKPWQAMLPATTHGIWKTSVNGIRTYYFAGYTGGAGMAPGVWILILSFDGQGRPVPFYVLSSGTTYDGAGISDLLNLDGTGPELLQQEWAETNWMPDGRSGYYITTLYQQRGLYWYRTDGQHGTRTFPLYEKWALLPDTRPELVADPGLPNWLLDYGNDPRSGTRTKILSSDEHGIHVAPDFGCELESVDVVIKNSKESREIDASGIFDVNRTGGLLDGIARAHLSVTLTGMKRWPGANSCVASILWANSDTQK